MEKIRFINLEHSVDVETKDKKRTTSAFYIPQALMGVFKELERKRNRTKILNYILTRYRSFQALGEIRLSENVKTQYQEKNLSLKRVTFKPDNKDWMELGILANAFGVSRAALFSFFLKLESMGVGWGMNLPRVRYELSYLNWWLARCIVQILPKDKGIRRILLFHPP